METLIQHLTTALGWSIFHSLWQGALLYSLLCMIYTLSPRSQARYRYRLAYAAQAMLLVLFFGTFVYYANKLSLVQNESSTELPLFISDFIVGQYPAPSLLERILPWLASIYILGLLFQFIFFGNSFSKLRQLRRSGLSEAPIEWLISLQELHQKLGIPKKVSLYLSDKVSLPLTLGHLKPLVLFPIAFVNQMDIKQVESVLLHELAHIKRNDYLFNLIKVAIETILFFNPFVWLLSKHIDTEREHACDDIVVEQIQSPIVYAQALLAVEEAKRCTSTPYAMSITGKQNHLLHRIQRITKMEKNYINVKQHLLAIAISTLAFGTLAWTVPTEQEAKNIASIPAIEQQNNPVFLHSANMLSEQIATDSVRQQTDTTKKKNQVVIINKDTIIRSGTQAGEAELAQIRAYYDSPEWKEHIAEIEENAKKVEDYYSSPRWKEHIAKIEENAKRVEDYYNSPEWKNNIAKIEENAKKVEEYYNSPKWKEHIAKIEANAKKIEEYYNSPEWKNNIAKIEENAKKVEEYYNSPKWKEHIAKIEANAKKIEEYYNSAEWKQKIADIESRAEEAARRAVQKVNERNSSEH